MAKLLISLMPTFYCTNNCNYCYLGDLRSNNTLLPIPRVAKMLGELKWAGFNDIQVQIYGGNLEEVKQDYLSCLCEVVWIETGNKPSIIGWHNIEGYQRSISLNKVRVDYDRNKQLLKTFPNSNVIVVALPAVIKEGATALLEELQGVTGYVTIVQYHDSEHNLLKLYSEIDSPNKDYNEFMIDVIDNYLKGDYTFNLTILDELEANRRGDYSCSDIGHLYINPKGMYCIHHSDETYTEFNTVGGWASCCEKRRLEKLKRCSLCEYYNKCFAEHMFPLSNDCDDCGGNIRLYKWWEKNYGRFGNKNK